MSDPGGVDTIVSSISWTLGADFENITLTGIERLITDSFNDSLTAPGPRGDRHRGDLTRGLTD